MVCVGSMSALCFRRCYITSKDKSSMFDNTSAKYHRELFMKMHSDKNGVRASQLCETYNTVTFREITHGDLLQRFCRDTHTRDF